MEKIILPAKIEYQGDKEKGEIIFEPCSPGYGTTWGNTLRRVLLSSLSGGAVTAIKIRGAKHEFSTLPGVKEDLLEIILNLKQLRLKIFTDEEVKLSLDIKGGKKVLAKDIEKNSQVEVVNPELLIATLTDAKAKLEMDIFVKKGIGYVTVEERAHEEKEVGKILIDSIFTPIRNVGLKIDNVRVGEKTNYDRLILPIETDGTITPMEALIEASGLLKEQFSYLADKIEQISKPVKKEREEKKASVKKEKVAKKVVKKVAKKAKKK
jgi:DNA-directed RNA polymerase subunit alpha